MFYQKKECVYEFCLNHHYYIFNRKRGDHKPCFYLFSEGWYFYFFFCCWSIDSELVSSSIFMTSPFFFLPNDDGILNPLYSHKKFTILLPVKRFYNFLKLIWKILTSKPHQSFLTHYFQRVNFRIYTHSRKNMFFCLFHTSFSC